MNVCIVGAGAIGGLIGTRLAQLPGCRVSALARGATLAALQAHGWRLETQGTTLHAPVEARACADELGPQDLVIIAVKSPALPALAPALAPLIGHETVILPAMNGVPWWFCQRLPGWERAPLQSVDPTGATAAALPAQQLLACVVHASAATIGPGHVRHQMGHGLIVGEPWGGTSERARRIGALLQQAGFEVTVSPDVRRDIWYKLWGNMTMNPVSALTGATVDRILADPLVRDLCSSVMREAAAIGERIGCPIDQAPEDRHAVTARLGAFRTSMLQDVEAGRPVELDALLGAVCEIGQRLGVPTPCANALLGLSRLFARQRGLYPA